MTGDWMSAAVPAAMGGWSVRLLDVSWQAGLLAAAAWAVCRLFPRMPAHVRATVWWLVCAKFLVGLAWIQPIALPVLPAESVVSLAPARAIAARAIGEGASSATNAAASGATSVAMGKAATADAATADSSSSIATSVPLALGAIWICGALLQLALTVLAWHRTRALVHDCTPADASIALLAHELSERIGAGRVDVRTSASIDTPRVTGAFSPVILLPAAAAQLSPADLEMTLCHELLHVRRGDLYFGWLPSLAQCVFFFHPCMWIATREYALAREAACDAAVLRLLDAQPDAYGALLLRLGIAHTDIAPIAVGASSSFRTLKRRLIMLQHTSGKARAHAARWWILAAAAALLIVPLRLVAQSPAAAPASAAAQTSSAPAIESQPAADPWTALKAHTWRAAQHIYNGTRDAWVLLRDGDDNNVTMSGSSGDISEAQRQREHPGQALLWFRHNGKSYVIRDPETLRTVRELWAPMEKLGEQQGVLGGSQGKLGDQQGELGAKQGMFGEEMSKLAANLNHITAEQLELSAKEIRTGSSAEFKEQHAKLESDMRRLNERMEALGRQQEELGHQQEALGREQEKFGRQQEALGRQQEEHAKRAERELREIIERAIASGIAQPAR
jgi:bla regulator protein BlaR1